MHFLNGWTGVSLWRIWLIPLIAPTLLLFLTGWAGQARAKEVVKKEIVAVLDLQGLGTPQLLPVAASDRLREELLNSGYFTLVGRNTLNKVLEEQALNQMTCLEKECALKLGRITGARIILTGKIVKIESEVWQASAELTDVETSETLRVGSVLFKGDTIGLIGDGIPELADKLLPEGDPSLFGNVVNFLKQAGTTLLTPENANKGETEGIFSQPQPEQGVESQLPPRTGFRIWGSPISAFILTFQDRDFNELEVFEGSGISFALEREFDRSWAVGTAISAGLLNAVESPTTGRNEGISGNYLATRIYVMDSVPNGNPWFYYGAGLMYAAIDFEDAGVSGIDSAIGPLFLIRAAYNFDSGFLLGLDIQIMLFSTASGGDRHDKLRQDGAANSSVSASVTSFILGYSF